MEQPLVDQIKRLRHNNVNCDTRHFVPELSLYGLVQETSIRSTIAILKIERYYLEELVREITQRARKVFAVLLLIDHGELITVMFKHDSLQNSSLDDELPFEEPWLKKILGDTSPAFEFYERQWEFITPIFSLTLLPRTFADGTILPFLPGQQPIGQGSFGLVSRVDIHPENHRLPLTASRLSV